MIISLTKDLDMPKALARNKIDRDSENMRMGFITPGSGQAMVYQQKESEAKMVLADPNVDPLTVPHIIKEAEMNGITPTEMANTIMSMADQWMQVSAIIELLRLSAKKAVDEATNPAEIEAATQINWSPIINALP